jgi:hypothetical protein
LIPSEVQAKVRRYKSKQKMNVTGKENGDETNVVPVRNCFDDGGVGASGHILLRGDPGQSVEQP